MKRDCPICSSDAKRNLYHQSFGDSPAAFPIKGYDVVVCQSCGLGYADGVPNQQEMDTYYKQVSKYEIADRAGKVSAVALKNYQDEVESLASFLPDKDVSILDIGCATGALLSVFQRNGYKNVRGIDPSPSCGRVAAELYAIEVTQGSVFEIGSFAEPFDVVVFSSVLEHVIDLRGALNRAKRMLAPDGLLVAEVPDTVNFNFGTSAPFQEFSVEHVNFFSPMSLSNLLRQEGFEVLAIWHDFRLMGTESFPSLTAVFRKKEVSETRAIIRDGETEIALERYIDFSRKHDEPVRNKIEEIVSSERPILIWGAGTQAQRLLASTSLGKAKIRAFVDSNANYQGKELNGCPILSPNNLKEFKEPIVISSQVFQEEIAAQIREVLKLDNEIIRLFAQRSF